MLSSLKSSAERFLPKSAFARGVGTLVGGTASAQLIGIAAAPILTRLYSPEDFGLLAVFAGLLAMVLVVSSLRYELAIPLPEDDQEAVHVVVLSLVAVFVTSGLSAVVVGAFGPPIARAVGSPSLANYLWLLPIGVAFGGCYSALTYWSVRKKDFPVLAKTKLRQALAVVATQVAGFKLGATSLLAGQVAGQSLGAWSLLHSFLSAFCPKSIELSQLVRAARRYHRFPVFSAPAGLMNSSGTNLPAILLSAFFNPSAAGFYLLSDRVVFAPSAMLQDAVSKVLFSNAHLRGKGEDYTTLVATTHRRLLVVAAPVGLFMALYAGKLFALLFSASWAQSGVYAQALAVMFIFQFTSSPLSVVLHSLHRPDLTLACNLLLFTLRIAGIFAGYVYGSALASVVCFSVLSAIGYHCFASVSATTAGVNLGQINRNVVIALAGASIVLAPSVGLQMLTGEETLAMAVGLVAILIYYTVWIRRVGRAPSS